MENIDPLESKMLISIRFDSIRWAANLKDFKHTETMARGKGKEREMYSENPIADDILKIED